MTKNADIRTSYTIRVTAEQKKQLQDKSNKLKLTVGNTIEYLLNQDKKKFDYFDMNEVQQKLDKIIKAVEGKK
jgi:macrodomain Ter protein organizer (MatP/YcbG family)